MRRLGLGLLISPVLAYPLLPEEQASIVSVVYGAVCVLVMGWGVRRNRRSRPAPWWSVTVGLGLLVTGDAT